MTLSSFKKKLGISVFIETAPAGKPLSWQQPKGCHFVSFVMHICFNSFRDIQGPKRLKLVKLN